MTRLSPQETQGHGHEFHPGEPGGADPRSEVRSTTHARYLDSWFGSSVVLGNHIYFHPGSSQVVLKFTAAESLLLCIVGKFQCIQVWQAFDFWGWVEPSSEFWVLRWQLGHPFATRRHQNESKGLHGFLSVLVQSTTPYFPAPKVSQDPWHPRWYTCRPIQMGDAQSVPYFTISRSFHTTSHTPKNTSAALATLSRSLQPGFLFPSELNTKIKSRKTGDTATNSTLGSPEGVSRIWGG